MTAFYRSFTKIFMPGLLIIPEIVGNFFQHGVEMCESSWKLPERVQPWGKQEQGVLRLYT